MTQSSEQQLDTQAATATQPAPASHRRTDRDLQRQALRDLVNLATGCTAAEAQIENRLRDETAAADRELQQTSTDLSQKLESLRQQVQKKHDDRLAEALAQFDFDTRAMREADQSNRSRISAEYEAQQQQIKQKLDQAVWLAESVFEATQIQVRKENGKSEEEYKERTQQLADMDSQAQKLLRLYGQQVAVARDADSDDARKSDAAAPAVENAEDAYTAARDMVKAKLHQLEHLQIPRLFVGARPYIICAIVTLLSVAATQFFAGQPIQSFGELATLKPAWPQIGYAFGSALGGLLVVGILLRVLGKSQVRSVYTPLHQSLDEARAASKSHFQHLSRTQDNKYLHALRKRDAEVRAAKEQAAPQLARAQKSRQAALDLAEQERKRNMSKYEARRDTTRAELDAWLRRSFEELDQRYRNELAAANKRHDERVVAAQNEHDDARFKLERRWHDGLQRIQRMETDETDGDGSAATAAPESTTAESTTAESTTAESTTAESNAPESSAAESPTAAANGKPAAPRDWNDPAWRNWTPPSRFSSRIPFGQLSVDLKEIAEAVPREGESSLELPETFSLPALLAFPRQSSLLIQYDRTGREASLRALQMVMTRLLTSLPAGRVRFTIIDPVGLGQNFAGFMHLADHDENLVGGRIWTNAEHIEQRLTDLTEHMETVIQKYLRNEFETIDDYNAQAGELAEPYKFLVIADFPISVSAEAIQKLNSIASTGARCGVYTLIARDLRAPLPGGAHIDELVANSVNLVQDGDRFLWKDEVFERFPLAIDAPPAEESLTEILNTVGRHAKDANRVEVPFETIAPRPDQFWTGDCTEELRVPIGRMGATRSQLLKLGKGVAQHALIAGKTGSGKSTLLHVLVTNLAMWYHPDEVEFYLVDFKKGVEFKTYATHNLPHARAIAVESDREFGLSVLQRLDAELSRRGELYRKLGVQDLAAYREASGGKLPRTLLIIDEFQEFFSEDDKLAQDAALLLDRLVRQGRAFGVHVLLGSQTIGGSSGLSRSTIGQMAVRIALQTSEADSQLILGDNNSAARLLGRPGEAIYNDQGGLVEGNSPFQISWLADEKREVCLREVMQRARREHVQKPEANVFEGNAAADIARNHKLEAALSAPTWDATQSAAPAAWLGEPVAIKDPTLVPFRRQSGANMLVIGQQEESAMAIMLSSMISLAAQHAPGAAKFYIFDGTPADSALAGWFNRIQPLVPHEVKLIEWRAVEDAMNEIAAEVQRRQESGDDAGGANQAIFVMIYGLQRYRVLRKSEESSSFNFSLDAAGDDDDADAKKKTPADKAFADILREGPALGVHVITWADAPAAVDRTLDRTSMREFDHRVLFQMSANDSSNLIDSPAANKLGFYRALAFSEEQGVLEKFRPYALPSKSWLEHVRERLAAKQ